MAGSRKWLGIFFLLVFSLAGAEVVKIEITSQAPFAGGKAFDAAGPYVRVTGRFHGELDPTHPMNRNIVDIRRAPRNARGRVEYSSDFEILRPADPFKGNGTLFYDVNNRGNKRLIHLLNDVAATNALDTPDSAGDGFLMRHGFTVAWSGWIPGMPRAPNLMRLEVPVAVGVEQPLWDEFLFNDATQLEARLSFSAATLEKPKAQLTVRNRNDDLPSVVPSGAWEFLDDGAIRLLPRGTPFRAGALYQFSYRARNPPVAGIGYAATRDWIGFLRYQQRDNAGTANPLGPDGRHKIAVALAHGTSQSGRFLRDMLYRGFNETEDLRVVFEGINPHIASARLYLNYRFAQPNRVYSLGYGFVGYPDAVFPFAYAKQRDPMRLREDGLLERCTERDNCPKILHTVSSTEYWQGGHSLNTTDPLGEKDILLPANVRIYHFAGTEHVITPTMPKGVCAAPPNVTVDPRPALRALILALDRWVKGGAPPPASVYPRIADGTLVPATAQKWPAIPGLSVPRSPNPMAQFEYGPKIGDGIIDTVPPAPHVFRYRVLVPAIDADGNEVAGLRMPEQAVPAATTTGWALRSPEGGAAGELCYLDGMALPFARTASERDAAQDPRPSLAERYQDRAGFLARIRAAAQDLQRRGFYLEEDVEKTVNRAARAW
ncbi:MAG: alpha/beta hydrolase domain-containing protein [Betaproteobacteria bacterium]